MWTQQNLLPFYVDFATISFILFPLKWYMEHFYGHSFTFTKDLRIWAFVHTACHVREQEKVKEMHQKVVCEKWSLWSDGHSIRVCSEKKKTLSSIELQSIFKKSYRVSLEISPIFVNTTYVCEHFSIWCCVILTKNTHSVMFVLLCV